MKACTTICPRRVYFCSRKLSYICDIDTGNASIIPTPVDFKKYGTMRNLEYTTANTVGGGTGASTSTIPCLNTLKQHILVMTEDDLKLPYTN